MNRFRHLFPHRRRANLICMLHLPPLPGSPGSALNPDAVAETACQQALSYLSVMGDAVDGLLVENMGDLPYLKGDQVGPEVTAAMAVACDRVRRAVPGSIPVGIQILAGANEQAVAVAHAAGLQFVRAEGFVFSHVADEGLMADACAGPLLRYRRGLAPDGDISVYCDVKKKHAAHAITADVSVGEAAAAAEFFRSDGVVLTGGATGREADEGELGEVLGSVRDIPVLVGSGVTADNVGRFADAHGLIVGSYFKRGGKWWEDLDEGRMERMAEAVEGLDRKMDD